MRRSTTSLMLSSALVIALAVAAGGCAIRGRATVTPMRAVVVAPQPAAVVVAPPPQPAAAVVYAQPDAGIVLGQGQVMTGVAVPSAPPPPPPTGVVAAPATRSGFVWVRGHYRWAGGHWIWTDGGWLRTRASHVWVQPRYDATRGLWITGYWTTRAPAQVSTGVVHHRSTPVRASVRIRAGASIQIR